MERQFHALPIHELGAGAGLRRPTQGPLRAANAESPALEVMTDLTRVAPATIRRHAPLAAANQFMIARGVRLLLVVDEHESVLGLITTTDTLGDKAMRVAMERGLPHGELTVSDLMTPAEKIEVLDYADVAAARAGHVLETLRRAGRQHALVVEREAVTGGPAYERPHQRAFVRGIFSLSQVARQLGVRLPPGTEVARTFAEIEAAVAR